MKDLLANGAACYNAVGEMIAHENGAAKIDGDVTVILSTDDSTVYTQT